MSRASSITKGLFMVDQVAEFMWDSLTAVSPTRVGYNNLRGQFVRKAEDSVEMFMAEYDQNIKNLDQLTEKVSDLAIPYIKDSVDDAVKVLIERKIYDVDSEHFIKNFYLPHDCWFDAVEKILDKYAEIVSDAEELDAYRISRSQERGRVLGGGFGLEGALKGMVVATTVNLAAGAAHGLLGLAEKSASAFGDMGRKREIFSDPETKNGLVQALYNSVLNVHLSLLDLLRKSNQSAEFQDVGSAEKDKAMRMLNNLRQGRIEGGEEKGVLREVLTLDPYLIDAYEYALVTYGDAGGGLEKVANFFHVNLRQKKREIILSLVRSETEDEVKASLDLVRDAVRNLEYEDGQSFVKELEGMVHELDVCARTFAGKLYSSREDKKAAEDQFYKEKKEKFDSVKSGVLKFFKRLVILAFLLVMFFIGMGITFAVLENPKNPPNPVQDVGQYRHEESDLERQMARVQGQKNAQEKFLERNDAGDFGS